MKWAQLPPQNVDGHDVSTFSKALAQLDAFQQRAWLTYKFIGLGATKHNVLSTNKTGPRLLKHRYGM